LNSFPLDFCVFEIRRPIVFLIVLKCDASIFRANRLGVLFMNYVSKRRWLIWISMAVILMPLNSVAAFDSPPAAEAYLHAGRFSRGESELLAQLTDRPRDDELRFGLGVIQFMKAIETLGQSLYKHGAVSDSAGSPLFRLPVPRNPDPAAVSLEEIGQMLDRFYDDLERAEATLSMIDDENVKLELRLAAIKFDFTATGEERTTLIDVLRKLNQARFVFEEKNPEFLVHFDRGDVAWLRAYCHLMCATIDGYRAFDFRITFEIFFREVFPKLESVGEPVVQAGAPKVHVIDPPRLRSMRLHLIDVCELNRETWKFIRLETDDDFEWLPHPKQTDMLELPINDRSIDAWLRMMNQLEGLFKGERLFPSSIIVIVIPEHKKGYGLNLKSLFDDPPLDIFNQVRLGKQGIDQKYLEPEKGRQLLEFDALVSVFQLFSGPFGFARAARLN
jgi:hypothetical protein